MAFPLRFKLINRQTKEVLKGDNVSALLLPSGQPAMMKIDFYTHVNMLSCADYELHLAVEKDDKGKWVYKQIGH